MAVVLLINSLQLVKVNSFNDHIKINKMNECYKSNLKNENNFSEILKNDRKVKGDLLLVTY